MNNHSLYEYVEPSLRSNSYLTENSNPLKFLHKETFYYGESTKEEAREFIKLGLLPDTFMIYFDPQAKQYTLIIKTQNGFRERTIEYGNFHVGTSDVKISSKEDIVKFCEETKYEITAIDVNVRHKAYLLSLNKNVNKCPEDLLKEIGLLEEHSEEIAYKELSYAPENTVTIYLKNGHLYLLLKKYDENLNVHILKDEIYMDGMTSFSSEKWILDGEKNLLDQIKTHYSLDDEPHVLAIWKEEKKETREQWETMVLDFIRREFIATRHIFGAKRTDNEARNQFSDVKVNPQSKDYYYLFITEEKFLLKCIRNNGELIVITDLTEEQITDSAYIDNIILQKNQEFYPLKKIIDYNFYLIGTEVLNDKQALAFFNDRQHNPDKKIIFYISSDHNRNFSNYRINAIDKNGVIHSIIDIKNISSFFTEIDLFYKILILEDAINLLPSSINLSGSNFTIVNKLQQTEKNKVAANKCIYFEIFSNTLDIKITKKLKSEEEISKIITFDEIKDAPSRNLLSHIRNFGAEQPKISHSKDALVGGITSSNNIIPIEPENISTRAQMKKGKCSII